MSDTTTPDPLFTMVYTPTEVVSIEPAAGKVWPGAPNKAVTGTQAQLDALRDRLKLTPLPDPAVAAAKAAAQKTFDAAVAAGYVVPTITPPLVLDLGDSARANFTGLLVLLNAQLAAGRITAADQFPVTDIHGSPRLLSVANVQTMILGYGEYYAGLFGQLHAGALAS